MDRSKSVANNVIISCGVLMLTAGFVLSLVTLGVALFVMLGG